MRRRLAENDLKPWRKDMWCIPRVDAEYVARMEHVLDLYFLLALGLLQSGDLRLREHQAVLRHLGLQRLQPLLGVGEIVPQPHPAHAEGRDRQALLLQFVRDPNLAPGRLLDRKLNHRRLNLGRHPVLQQRLAPADLLQRQLAALLVQLLEAVEAVARVAQHLAGLAHIAELLGQLQQPDLPSNDFLVLGHGV